MTSLPGPTPRNEPCPCGSGRRFKQCHGALRSDAPPHDDPDARTREGIEAHRAGRIEDAERSYAAALASAPDHPYAGQNIGVLALQRRNYEEAIPPLERSVSARPDEPEFHGNLGLAYAGVDRFDDAVAAHRRSLALRPDQPVAWNNLGLALVQLGRYSEAIDAYRRALAIDPAYAKARWNLAMARLALGDRGAWDDFEARLDVLEPGTAPDAPGVPRYRGGDLRGRTLLLEDEQGYGDTLQFVRFAEMLASRGARVVVRARTEIAALLRTVPGVADVVPLDATPACDAWLPLMSLPAVLCIDPHGAAPNHRYVSADRALCEVVRLRLASDGGRLRVGLSWAGNPGQVNNRRRACPLAALAPLLERPGIAWYSLQREDGEDQIASLPAAASLRLLDERNDFDGKAALVSALDLVISVCTSNAHLAGALGRPTWIMLAHVPDWRWGIDGDTTGWYPTARLFRQRERGDWEGVVTRIGAALDAQLAKP